MTIAYKLLPHSMGIISVMTKITIKAGIICLLLTSNLPAQSTLMMLNNVDDVQSLPPQPWEIIQFTDRHPPTQYRVTEWDGVVAIEAVANASMALLARPIEIDLEETPVLCWRWRIDKTIESANMLERSGDDYAARIYVSFSIPKNELDIYTRIKLNLARKRYGDHIPDAAINYVWDNNNPVGTQLPNAYTDRTQMFVVKSGNKDAGKWVEERRDVLQDLKNLFGDINATPMQLAIATDTDNTGETARAGFSDLHFVDRDANCQF
ncbi:MAG: DUF3047 domain-containing protein [Gammaproteobacteria bacterium]|jgi:hypothetical protein